MIFNMNFHKTALYSGRILCLFYLILSFEATLLGQDKPNIIWISAEDMSPRLPAYGDSTIKSPHISRLAKEGIIYDHVYTTAGVCAPSRNAIITGSYQTYNGGHNMRTLNNTYPEQTGLPKSYSAVMPAEIRCFPEYLRQQGYYTTNNNNCYRFLLHIIWSRLHCKVYCYQMVER